MMLAGMYRSPFAPMFLARETNEERRIMPCSAARIHEASLPVCRRPRHERVIRTLCRLPMFNDEETSKREKIQHDVVVR